MPAAIHALAHDEDTWLGTKAERTRAVWPRRMIDPQGDWLCSPLDKALLPDVAEIFLGLLPELPDIFEISHCIWPPLFAFSARVQVSHYPHPKATGWEKGVVYKGDGKGI